MHPLTPGEETQLAAAVLKTARPDLENITEFAKVARAKVANAIALLDDYGIDQDDPLALLLAGARADLDSLIDLLP